MEGRVVLLRALSELSSLGGKKSPRQRGARSAEMQWPALALLLAAGAHGAEGAGGSGSGACVDHGFAYNSTLACQLRKVARGSNVINTTGGRFCDGAFGKKYCCARWRSVARRPQKQHRPPRSPQQ